MAELIPTLNTCLPKMTSGEKRLAQRLESLLEDDYICWYDIPVGRLRRYPDFIILHPARGLLFLEVKDWKLDTIKSIDAARVELLTPKGIETTSNPIEQVRQCSYQVIDKLKRDKLLINQEGKYKGNLCLPYGYGVVLTNITRMQLDRAIPLEAQDSILPHHLVICKDEMISTIDPESFQSKLWHMFNYQFGNKLTLPQVDRIRWHLFPEIRISSPEQQTLLPLDSDDESVNTNAYIPDIIKIMDIQQEQLARSLGDGHRVIHGVAGSGKTLILGYRCLHLAEQLKKPILVLCFNITLAARLRSFIDEKGISGQVQVYHFHDWCGQQIKTYHLDVIKGDAPYWERQVETVINGVEKGDIPKGQYGALLIDEGHDFEAEWLTLVTQMIDPDTNSLLLLYDDAQSIYKKKNNLDFSLASVGIQAQGRTTVLRLNYRNTREILSFSYNFAKQYFENSDAKEIPLIHPESAGITGTHPVVKKFSTMDQEVEYAIKCLVHWQKKGYAWSDIAIIYPCKHIGQKVSEALQAKDIPYILLAKSEYKKKYNPSTNVVNVLPIPSSKGLEFKTVVILNSSNIPKKSSDRSEDIRRLYVGMTRATHNLLATYHKENELSESLEAAATINA
ncbi:DNA helicase II [Aliivibrio finisterrensis]|uniref:3'-5' exonuclease n=1 Tax=Aliivibrio finisterrensis TaxID=511998 RepID=UPI00101E925F|nr:nuclease-related domain-containing DEAD/DEAH box helicase [Aliivibrio finisterrensis]RYU70354.1 DNA helicase II [Aliivibrio finisterrensis]RYU76821.1 DNA helicase II [Aliivibrio finisterrensis]